MGAPPAVQAPRKSRKVLWISLGVVAALLLLTGGGAAFAIQQYTAPAAAATQFCNYLKAQNYSLAYGMLSSELKAQISSDTFTLGSQTLDKLEGPVLSCGQASVSNAYSYSLGSSTATLIATMSRATAGHLQGTLSLKSENGSWTIAAIGTSLLGVNLGALQAAGAFCAALQAQNYTAAYGLLGTLPQSAVTQADFTQAAHLHDELDGPVTACGLAGLGSSNTDTNADMTVTITRSKLGQRQGGVSLDVENGAWKISNVAPDLEGRDIGPLVVGVRFCADLAQRNYADIYANVLSSNNTSGTTAASWAGFFDGAQTGVKWVTCVPNLSSYTVSGTSASLDTTMTFRLISAHQTVSVPVLLKFIQEGIAWKLNSTANG
jgi:hypothetical protein